MWRWLERFGYFSPERRNELIKAQRDDAEFHLRKEWGARYDHNMKEVLHLIREINIATEGALSIGLNTEDMIGNRASVAIRVLNLSRRIRWS